MIALTDEHIDFIYNDVQQRGIRTDVLLHELVDHICCQIEAQAQPGEQFDVLYQRLVASLPDQRFREIQFQTDLSTDSTYQRMKKILLLSGAVGASMLIGGVLFKVNHFPGANLMLVLATGLIAFVFLPLFFIVSHREAPHPMPLPLSVLSYTTLVFLVLGPMFKIMHWPMANLFLYIGPGLLAALLLPAYLVSVYRKANETKTNRIFLGLMVAIGFSFLYTLSAGNLSHKNAQNFYQKYQQNLDAAQLLLQRNNALVGTGATQAAYLSARNELLSSIDQTMLELIRTANSPQADLSHFDDKTDRQAGTIVLHKHGAAHRLSKALEQYQHALAQQTQNTEQQRILSSILSMADERGSAFEFDKAPLILILYKLSEVKMKALLAERQVLQG